jgi:2-amino-4-hydroxy-6-hydroxymethyldihydropteridine diphosphokinase
MTDTIFITGLVIHARHGVMDHETEVGQRFVIDLELFTDLSESSHTDRLVDTVSYSNVVATATAAFKNTNYKLLERAAGAVADSILAAFSRIRRPMADVLIALGGNLGDVRTTFEKAIANICGMTQGVLLARSSDYATPPWGEEEQARFINACIEIETSLDPHALLFTLHKIEKKFGRDRAHEKRWGPRTLDLDLIAYDEVRIDKPELTLPHPRLFERAFVLVPLAEIAPDRVIAGRSITAALAGLSTDGIERLPDLP